MLPIDHNENSKRVLETGQYQIPGSRGKEDKWLFSYLKTKGVSKQEAYEIWLPIFNTRNFCYNGSVIATKVFDDLWAMAKKCSLRPRFNKIVFYKEEIEFLKSLPIKRWQKEFFLMTYGILKAKGKREMSYLPISDVLCWTSLYMRHGKEGADIEMAGNKNEVFCHLTESKWDSTYGMYDEYDSYVFPGLKDDGEQVIECASILDVPKHFDEIFGIRECTQCGKMFFVSEKAKTTLCPDCYTKNRELNHKYVERVFYERNLKKQSRTTTCPECGREFEKTSKSKTDLCGGCWRKKEAYRKNYNSFGEKRSHHKSKQ